MAHALSYESPGPDRPLPGARHALILLVLMNLFNLMDRQILAAVLPEIQKEFLPGHPRADELGGWLMTAFLLSYVVFSPIFGFLADRMSRWVLVGIGVSVWSIATGASGIAWGYWILLITRAFVGIGEAAYGPAAPTLISDFYPVKVRGSVLAFFYAAIPVGGALGYALGGFMGQYFSWHWAFIVVVLPGIALGVWSFLMKEPPRGVADATRSVKLNWRDYLILLRTPSYVLNCLAMTAMTFAIGGVATWMPKYIHVYRGWGTLAQANLVFGGITVVGGLVATLFGGWLGDKLRDRFPGSYFLVSSVGMLAGFPCFLAMLVTPFPWNWGVIFLLVLCLFLNTGPSNTALANVTHPSMRATAFAINIFFIHMFGDAISPPIMGAISDRWNMTWSFRAVSVMVLIGGLLWLAASFFLARDTARAPRILDAKT